MRQYNCVDVLIFKILACEVKSAAASRSNYKAPYSQHCRMVTCSTSIEGGRRQGAKEGRRS